MVSTPLKNISQLGVSFPIYGKIKNVPNHQQGLVYSGSIRLVIDNQINVIFIGKTMVVGLID